MRPNPKELGSSPSAHAGGLGGGTRIKTTRKNLALTGENETVCSGDPPPGRLTIVRKFCPSLLASRDFSGLAMPVTIAVILSTSLVAIVRERMVSGCGNSYCIHAF